MALNDDWKIAGGFNNPPVKERPDALKIEMGHVYLFLKIFILFLIFLAVEYPLCGIYFRLLRPIDRLWLNGGCALASLALCSWFSRKLIQDALKERIAVYIVAGTFVVFVLLLALFFRFSFQLANGFFDSSDPEVRTVEVTDKKISVFGGSFREGPSPMAHLVYFRNGEHPDEMGEVLMPPTDFYALDLGTPFRVAVQPGFFHVAWVSTFQLIQPHFQGEPDHK